MTLDDCVWGNSDFSASVDVSVSDWAGVRYAPTANGTKAPPPPAAGIGDEAYYYQGFLYVRKGDAGGGVMATSRSKVIDNATSDSFSVPTGDVQMTRPEIDVARIRRWVDARNARLPERAVGQIRFEMDVDDRAVTLLECRPPWQDGFGPEWTRFLIARLRYTKLRREWQIYWRDQNLKFRAYGLAPTTTNVDLLLAEIDSDPAAIFLG